MSSLDGLSSWFWTPKGCHGLPTFTTLCEHQGQCLLSSRLGWYFFLKLDWKRTFFFLMRMAHWPVVARKNLTPKALLYQKLVYILAPSQWWWAISRAQRSTILNTSFLLSDTWLTHSIYPYEDPLMIDPWHSDLYVLLLLLNYTEQYFMVREDGIKKQILSRVT